MASAQKGADTQQQTILFLDASGFYPLPSVLRTDAPVGQTPILREWWTREHLSAISAISPEGKLYFHCQEGALNSADVVAFLEPLPREVPGHLVISWDGAPMHRSRGLTEVLANGARQRLHVERLPADAPDLGVERRHVCCFSRTHLRQELCDAVKRVRRKPRIIKGCFEGAKL